MKDISDFPIRTCRTLHSCFICNQDIRWGCQYYDGGYGKRAHVRCVNETNRPSSRCNVCGRELISDPEFEIGMCSICAVQ